MLRFADEPDPVFTVLISAALDRAIGEISELVLTERPPEDHATWGARFPSGAHTVTPPLAVETLQRLRAAHAEARTLYALTAYHRRLLSACLQRFGEAWNDTHATADAYSVLGPFKVQTIAWGLLLDHFFPDTEFLESGEALRARSAPARDAARVLPDAVGLSPGFAPHADNLPLAAQAVGRPRPFAPVPAPWVVLAAYPSAQFPPPKADHGDEEGGAPAPLFTPETRGEAFEHWWTGHHRQLGDAETTARFHAAMFAVFSRLPLEDAYGFLAAEPVLQGPYNAPKRAIAWEHGQPVLTKHAPLFVRIPPQACATDPQLAYHLARHAALALHRFRDSRCAPGTPEATRFIDERLAVWDVPRPPQRP